MAPANPGDAAADEGRDRPAANRHHSHHAAHHHHGAASGRTAAGGGLGPKRKSKVGIAGLHASHSTTTVHRTSSARAKSSQSLANLAQELVAAANDSSNASSSKMERNRSRESNKQHHSSQHLQRTKSSTLTTMVEPSSPAATTGTTAQDAEAGWISAASSSAPTPEQGNSPEGTTHLPPAPSASPSSYQPLEFKKKDRKKRPIVQNQFVVNPDITVNDGAAHDYRNNRPLETIQGSAPPSNDTSAVGTPRQESALSLAAPKALLSPTSEQEDAITPIAEKQLPLEVKSQPQLAEPAEPTKPDNQQVVPPAEEAQKTGDNDVPVAGPSRLDRPARQRKSSTSTMKSRASAAGAVMPLVNTGLWRQTATPLQPRLDTSAPVGVVTEINSNSFSQPGVLASTIVASPAAIVPPTTASSAPGHKRSVSSASVRETNQTQRSSTGRAGTLTSTEANDLAQRLRTVSGTDLHASVQKLRRGPLIRSASSASTATLTGTQDQTASQSGSVASTLKRASGYFGSISRLATLAGFTTSTSSRQSSGSATSPRDLRFGSPTNPLTALSTSPGQISRHQQLGSSSSRSQRPPRPALISKFIDPDDAPQQREAMRPLPRAESSAALSQQQTSGGSGAGKEHRSTSRAGKKMMTQRDAPYYADADDDLFGENGQGQDYRSSASEEDFAQMHNRTPRSSASTPSFTSTQARSGGSRQPGVQRWIFTLVKEAERIDRDHESAARFGNTVQLSFARILEKRYQVEEEEKREERLRLRRDGHRDRE